jgi:hypothetical protein
MKPISYLFIILGIFSCSTIEVYKLYRSDKSRNHPKEELTLKLVNDTTGLFINSDVGRKALTQKFHFIRRDGFLLVEDIMPENSRLISLQRGDTIIAHKNHLYFFYDGDKKFFLSFRKKNI